MEFNDLPEDIILEIFSLFPRSFLITSLCLVNKRWNALSFSPVLWRKFNLYNESFFIPPRSHNYNTFLSKIGSYVIELRTRLPYVWDKFQPEMFPQLRSLKLRMYQSDDTSKLDKMLDCYKALECITLDISKFDGLNNIISVLKKQIHLKKFQIRHFFCNHSTTLKLMPTVFQAFFQATNLTHVRINCGDVYLDIAIKTLLKHNKNLLELDLSRCTAITSLAFNDLTFCKLQSLNLSRTAVDDEGLKSVSENCPHLSCLSIMKCVNVTDMGVQFIAKKCKSLQSIEVNAITKTDCCHVTNVGLSDIAEQCKDLRKICISFHPQVEAGIFLTIGHLCCNIRVIEAQACRVVDDKSLVALSELYRTLLTVNFSECTKITGIGVSCLLSRCVWLRSAYFNSCPLILNIAFDTKQHEAMNLCVDLGKDDITPNDSGTSGPYSYSHLRNLSLSFCQYLSPDSFKEIARFCHDLTCLHMAGWVYENADTALIQLVKDCSNLQEILCSGIVETLETNFTDEALSAIASYGRNCRKLIAAYNRNISINGILEVIRNCKKLGEVTLFVNSESLLTEESVENLPGIMSGDGIILEVFKYKLLNTTACQISIKHLNIVSID